jgi:hypothetical protein
MEFDWFLSKIILKHTLFISDQTPDYQNYIYEKQRINSKEISITRGIVFFYIFFCEYIVQIIIWRRFPTLIWDGL